MTAQVSKISLAVALGLSAVGCAVDEEARTAQDAEEVELIEQRLATAADIAHACEHARNPPGGGYLSTNASASAGGASPAWSEHEAYDVTLPLVSAGSYGGWGVFTPDESAEHGIYTDPAVSVSVRVRNADGSLGATVSQVWSTTLTTSNCPGSSNPALPQYGTAPALSRVRTFHLNVSQQYYVRFSNGSNKLLTIFENLDEQP